MKAIRKSTISICRVRQTATTVRRKMLSLWKNPRRYGAVCYSRLGGIGGVTFFGAFQYIATPWGFAAFALVIIVISVGLFMVVKGRIDVNEIVKKLE